MNATTPGVSALQALATREADWQQTLAQLGRRLLLQIGAREFVHDGPGGRLMFRVGDRFTPPAGVFRKVIVVLRADDTYAVEVGRVQPVDGVPTWVSEAVEGVDVGLYGDQLSEAVQRVYTAAVSAQLDGRLRALYERLEGDR